MSTPAPSPAHTRASLHSRILGLSRDWTPAPAPALGSRENLEERERRKADEFFQYALCRRIWWHLTPDERDDIRTMVLAENPSYRTRPEGYCFDNECIAEVRRLLADGSADA